MKRLYVIFLSLIFLAACNDTPPTGGVLTEKKMINVMVDLHLIDGYMSTLMYTDSVRIAGRNYYATVYKNHKISKTEYNKSLKYYSSQPVLLDSMYSRVTKILAAKEKSLIKKQEDEQKKMMKSK